MRWTSKPEWPPILVAALGGAIAVPFAPFVNATLKHMLVFVPTPIFYLLGIAMGAAISAVTWRIMMAGLIQLTEQGVTLYRYERTVSLPWSTIEEIDEQKQANGNWKARITTTGGTAHMMAFQRLPRADFQRMRRRITIPVLEAPKDQRLAIAKDRLAENKRDDLILTILRMYAVLIGVVAALLSWIL